jgi:hypothetical protein
MVEKFCRRDRTYNLGQAIRTLERDSGKMRGFVLVEK